MKKLILAAATLAIGSFSQAALAADTGSMGVAVTVAASCDLTVNEGMTFGGIATRTTGALHTASTTITVACTADAAYEVGFDYGLSATGSPAHQRRLHNATADIENPYLTYGLYHNTGTDEPWGNERVGEETPNVLIGVGTTTIADDTFTVYGKIDAGQDVSLGVYADTVTATVWYN